MKPVPIWRRFDRLLGPNAKADIRAELRFHIDCKTEDLIRQGWRPEAARNEAERQFGNILAVQQIGERIGGSMQQRKRLADYWIDSLQDIRYTFRTLGRDPGFTLVSILILAIAIGANTAVFSVVNDLLLRPLPFPDSQQLVWIAPPPQKCGLSCATYSSDAYETFRDQSRVYQGVTGYMAFSGSDNMRLTGLGDPPPATGIDVIGNFFQVLGVQPSMGRLFTAEETRPGQHRVTLLSNAFWRRQFHSDPAIVGKTIDMNSTPYTVVGVLPPSFDFGAFFSPGARIDLFTPLDLDASRNWGNIVTFMGRLKPGVTLAQAQGDGLRVEPKMCWNNKQPLSCGSYVGKDSSMLLRTLKDYVSGRLRRSLIVLWSAVGAILLIAGVNLSNLLLARAATRAKEFAVRGALGASRARIVGQLLLESLVLSGTGALLGLALAYFLVLWLAHQGSLELPMLAQMHLDGQACGWTILVAIATALLFGLIPGARMASGNLHEAIKDSSAGSGQSRKHNRVRAALVLTEVALACVLLVSAGLLLRSFMKVIDIDLGFAPSRAAAIKVEYDDSAPTGQASAVKRGAIFSQVLNRIGSIPGVEAAGISDYLPLGANRSWGSPCPRGRTCPPGSVPSPLVYVISPGYIHAMGMRLHGRDFTWSDNPTSQPVVLINASMARTLWPGEDAVGKVLAGGGNGDVTVAGVVDDVHADSVENSTSWQIYYPITQAGPNAAQLVIRTSLQPSALASTVLQALRELNPNQPAAAFLPIQNIVDRAVSPRRFFMILVAAFALLGLSLAALGIYGVISYSVTQKTQEIGVRMALGATTARVRRDVLGETLRLTVSGLILGGIGSFAIARLIATLLFATSPWDLLAYAGTVLALVAVALLSGYLPARRASRIHPMEALRNN
jgi:predicted permease